MNAASASDDTRLSNSEAPPRQCGRQDPGGVPGQRSGCLCGQSIRAMCRSHMLNGEINKHGYPKANLPKEHGGGEAIRDKRRISARPAGHECRPLALPLFGAAMRFRVEIAPSSASVCSWRWSPILCSTNSGKTAEADVGVRMIVWVRWRLREPLRRPRAFGAKPWWNLTTTLRSRL
jgi:hypothetical protein